MNIQLKLPESIALSPHQFKLMQMYNEGLKIQFENDLLIIEEAAVKFSLMDFLELAFPFPLSEKQFVELSTGNTELKKMEYNQEKIQVNMAITGLIGAFSAALLIALGIWNEKTKAGKIYNDPTGYELKDKLGNKIQKIPDVSFLAFENLVDGIYNKSGFISTKPFFIIEIVSYKYSLQQDLRKMAEHWMPNGTEIGLVVDPHRKEYHLFTQKDDLYQSFPFSTPFTHKKLPKLSIPFDELLMEAKDN